MAAWLSEQASKNTSFCGPFCYENNNPQKMFAGSQNPVPASMTIEAFARLEAGRASPEQVYAMGQSISESNVCSQGCNKEFSKCVAKEGDWKKAEDIDMNLLESCATKAQTCLSTSCE